jgi:hypothetical protein
MARGQFSAAPTERGQRFPFVPHPNRMRVLLLASILALARTAAAQPAPATRRADPPQAKIDPVPKQDAAPTTGRTDLVSALRDLRLHLKAWLADPVGVSRGLRNSADTITIIKIELK